MDSLTPEEINRRVAEALEWDYGIDRVIVDIVDDEWVYADGNPLGPEGFAVDFCADPAAADLVRQEIENRRGVLMEQSAPCGDARVWFTDVDIVSAQRSAQSTEGRGYALCLAFLAADQAQKEAASE